MRCSSIPIRWAFLLLSVSSCVPSATTSSLEPGAAPKAVVSTSDTAIRLLIPLYSYPNWYDAQNYIWDDIVAASSRVPITVIINPSSGPGGGPPNSDYEFGLNMLRQAGVTILGYVYTDYGKRDVNDVKADVDLYDRHFGIDGIFFDCVASDAGKLSYYEELCHYVESLRNLRRVILNPGTHIDEDYFSQAVGDIIVVFEGYSEDWYSYQPDTYLSTYPAEQLAILVHTVPDTDTMRSHIELALKRNIGYVYVTHDKLQNPWDSLPTFWETEIDHIASLNGDGQ